jgi:hypothetical protein
VTLGLRLTPSIWGSALRGSGGSEPVILLSGWDASEDAALGDPLATLSINGATGNWLDPITYTFVGTNHDGNRVAIDGSTVERGATALDYEDHPVLTFEIQADNGTDTPITRTFVRDVTNVLEVTLNALTLDDDTIVVDSVIGSVVGALVGTSSGSTLTLISTSGGKYALDGLNIEVAAALAEGSDSITVRETHADATNSPRDTIIGITVTPVSSTPSMDFSLASNSGYAAAISGV